MPKETFWNLPEEKRETFTAIALEEFATHDYENASISRIVAKAGIAKGSVYQYFDNKLELYTYLLELVLEKKRAFLSQRAQPDASESIFAMLHWLFKHSSEFELCYPQFSQLGYRAAYGKTPLPASVREQALQGTSAYFEELVRVGKERGELDPSLDPVVAAFIFTAIFEQLGRFLLAASGLDRDALSGEGRFPEDAPRVQAAFDQLLRLLQHGMGYREGDAS